MTATFRSYNKAAKNTLLLLTHCPVAARVGLPANKTPNVNLPPAPGALSHLLRFRAVLAQQCEEFPDAPANNCLHFKRLHG